MRMSDILRGGGEWGKEEKKTLFPIEKRPLEPLPPPKAPPAPLQMRPKEPEGPPKVPAEVLYNALLDFVKTKLFIESPTPREVTAKEIQTRIEPLLDRLADETGELMYLAVTRSTPEYYLHAHAVNVTILSLRLGVALGYGREELLTLGMGALLHDIGMIKVINLAQKKELLTSEERRTIEQHTRYSVDILKEIKDLSSASLEIAETAHERINGTGYPQGIGGSQLSEAAQIVAITDVYEALTHSRSYRDKLLPYEALKEILKTKELFHPKVLKTFVQYITVYPIGCWVELSTGEIGQVVNVSTDLPLRPNLKIMYDHQLRPVSPEKLLDLKKHSTLYIKRVLDERELQRKKERGFGG